MKGGARPYSFVWLLAAAQLVAWGSLYYAFAVAVVPMEAELGWSKTSLNGALSVGLLSWGLCAPVVGQWIDRNGARAVMIGGAVAGGLLMVAWSQVQTIWVFYLIWAAMGAAMACLLYEPVFAVVTALYGTDYRRAITAITLLGGFASTVLIPVTQMLCDAFGWRHAIGVIGLFCIVFVGGLHAVLLRPGDGKSPHQPQAVEKAGGPLVLSPVFLGLAVWFTAYGAIFTGLTFQLIPLMSAHDLDSGRIIIVMALIGPMQVFGRIVLLALGRRQTARGTGAFVVISMLGAVTILLLAPGYFPALVAFALLYGAGNGIMTIVRGTAVPEYLGNARYGATNGALALPINIAKAVSPLALAGLWSATGSPRAVILALLVCCSVALAGYLTATFSRRSA
ncbi:MAG: major facilitator superfamily [Rhodospirillaceae bacterium]|nr:MAG: major facilitator superfamily [Rhodospirillaceae bacterium]TNC98792.1 MAG: major facilitator superfamily protein [Stygiobacter sp.]